MDLADVDKTSHPSIKEYTFLADHETFSKGDPIRYKTHLNKYLKVEITPCILTNQYRFKLDIKAGHGGGSL